MFDIISDLKGELLEHPPRMIIHLLKYWKVVLDRLLVGLTKYQVVVGDNRIGREPRCEVFISNPREGQAEA
jgi:hypothetical protein